jgi:prephenate dehydrogenase
VRWNKVTIVGVGLLGGSLGLALRRRGLARLVAGYVRRPASGRDCERAGATDFATTDLLAAVSNSDLVVLCTPLFQMKPLVCQMLPALKRGAIVTDVGSVKAPLVRDLELLVARSEAHFIGSHPMAGAEKTGVRAARADLFQGAACVVTPTRRSNKSAVQKIGRLWRSVGGRVLQMTPKAHDALVSRSSHLPHLVAAALVTTVLEAKRAARVTPLCASGFRDSTRIASGSPEMWRDIGLSNRREILSALDAFESELKKFKLALRESDAAALAGLLNQAKARRDAWKPSDSGTSPE